MRDLFRNNVFVYIFLLICCCIEATCLGSVNPSPLLPHKDTGDQREFQNVYQNMAKQPSIYIGAGAPTWAPQKIGDIFISTTTAKIYISTNNVGAGSWTIAN